jgi:hypothetical protein
MLKSFGIFGMIKVYEVTVGVNGWHLHIHEIALAYQSKAVQYYEQFEEIYYLQWSKNAMLAGFDMPSRANGLQVQNGDFAAAYLAKYGKEKISNWNESREMTKQHIKKSKSGFSPFDLMRVYRDTPSKFLADLILEYGLAMFGTQQLRWSPGLKKLVNVEEIKDKQIIDNQEMEATLLGLISLKQWKYIIKLDLRCDVLLLAKYHGFSALSAFLLSIGAPLFEN